MRIDFRYFDRDKPTIPWGGCACSNPPFELCVAGKACELDACSFPDKMEPIEDED